MSSPHRALAAAIPFACAALACLLTAAPAAAATVSIPAASDNTVYQEEPTFSNGAGDHLFAGRTDDDFPRRAPLRFDIAAALPSGATINSVTLTLYRSRGKNGTFTIAVHRALSDWGEAGSQASGEEGKGAPAETGDATWDYAFYPSVLWATTGGDFAAAASASTPVSGNGFYTWSSASMVADVQAWLDSPATNFGWFLVGDEFASRTARRFDSRTNPTVAQRPQLTIDFTTTISEGACCLPSDSCIVASATECAAQSGTYQGDGTTCFPDPCNVPTGACCFDDGTCSELTAAECATQSGTYQGDDSACRPGLCPLVLEPFVDPLPIPSAAVPTSGTQGGTATYDIAMTEFLQQLHRDLPPTRVWGYGGTYPGPTIEATRDQPVTVNWINDLRDSNGDLRTDHFLPVDLCMHGPDTEGSTPRTVVHLHGGHVPPEADGYPEHTFLPGQQATYVYPNNQQAGPLWYHDHALGITRLNVQMGLAGLYRVRDAVESALNLPEDPYEIPLVIQDRTLAADGSIVYPADWQGHFFGELVLVNGKVWPFLEVQRGKYRLLLVNGSNSRVYTLKLSTGDPFVVIGTDGGLIASPVSVDSLTITPGERYDVVVDFDLYSPGTEIVLQNSAPAPFPGNPGERVIPNVMKFIVQGGSSGFTDPLPATLRPVPAIPESAAVEVRNLVLDKGSDPCAGAIWTINGLHWDDITEYPVRGTSEIWRFINDTGVVHPMHMHLVFFQVLDRTPVTMVGDSVIVNGPPVPASPQESGWKDTAPVNPGEMLRVIATFDDYLGKYAYHCHILEHEDHEMMRQFQVVAEPVSVTEVPASWSFMLSPVRPNPFGPVTRVSFDLPRRQRVSVRVLDVRGRLVVVLADGVHDSGPHQVVWRGRDRDGSGVPPGLYFVELRSGSFHAVRKATLLR